MSPGDPDCPWGPVPIHQALPADELLGVLPGDAPMEPGLGAVDGCGETGIRCGGEPPPRAGTPPRHKPAVPDGTPRAGAAHRR